MKVGTVRKTFRYSGVRPLDSLATAIEASEPQVIVPCDDRAVCHLHELHALARLQGASARNTVALIERSLGMPDSYPVVSARYNLLKLAREEGLSVPNTELISTLEDLRSWCAERTLPLVLKADGTWGGYGVKIAHTLIQAEQSFLELIRMPGVVNGMKRLAVDRDRFWLRSWWRRTRPPVIVQSYIHGRPANCAVVCWEGKVLAGIGVEVLSTGRRQGPATVVRVVSNPDMMLCAERIARRLGLSGFFGLDFVIEDGSEAIYLIEMNPRCTQLCHLQLGKGRDLTAALCAKISGQPLREIPPITLNDRIAYFPDAWSGKSDLLEACFPDIPMGEIDLIRELLGPASDRTAFGRLVDQLCLVKIKGREWRDESSAGRVAMLEFSKMTQRLAGDRYNSAKG
jgi:hypothetical protein